MTRAEQQHTIDRPTRQQCGTYAGYASHYRHGEDPCTPCERARTEYNRQRQTRADVVAERRVRAGARLRAFVRLAAVHPDEYRRLLTSELAVGWQRHHQARAGAR